MRESLGSLVHIFRTPIASETKELLQAAWQRLPGTLRTPHQYLGRQYAGCGATTPLGQERFHLCVVQVPIGDQPVSMCEVNALGVRDRYYTAIRECVATKSVATRAA